MVLSQSEKANRLETQEGPMLLFKSKGGRKQGVSSAKPDRRSPPDSVILFSESSAGE